MRIGLTAAASQLDAQTVKLATISEGTGSWPLYVAQAKHLFEREGITVEATLTRSSAKQLEALIEGGYDIGFQQSDHVVRAVERGSDLFAFMATAHPPELSLVAAPSITGFDDLKGKTLAVDGARSGYALLLRKLLADRGLREGSYTFTEFGGSKERFDALKDGKAVASFLNPPFDRRLFADGFKSLGTTADFFPSYPGGVAAARRAWARDNGGTLVAFIRAFNAAFAWLHDRANKAEAVAILVEWLKAEPQQAASAYDAFVARPRPLLAPESLRQVIDIVWDSERFDQPKGGPDKYLDLRYFEKAAAR